MLRSAVFGIIRGGNYFLCGGSNYSNSLVRYPPYKTVSQKLVVESRRNIASFMEGDATAAVQVGVVKETELADEITSSTKVEETENITSDEKNIEEAEKYGYLDRGYSTEGFKIELSNIPGYHNMGYKVKLETLCGWKWV